MIAFILGALLLVGFMVSWGFFTEAGADIYDRIVR